MDLESMTVDLDYFKLLKQSRKLSANATHRRVRLALLADCTTSHLAPILRVLAAGVELDLELYEAGFDSMDQEILDPNSTLYRFAPHFVLLLNVTEKIKLQYYQARQPTLADEILTRLTQLWESLKANSRSTVIQSTFVLPFERFFGNYDRKATHSIYQFVLDVNTRLTDAARTQQHVLINDVDHLAGYVGRKNWIDEKLWVLAKEPCALEFLPLLAKNIVDIIASAVGRITKCVVLDLDNTLWGGVIAEDGLEGIRLGDFDDGEVFVAFQYFIRALKERGIVLAICSKNEYESAILPFRAHPDMILRESDIAVFVANWEPKSDGIRHIQKTLNIAFDSIVFIDDSPFERNLVRELLPGVIVPALPEDPTSYIRTICELNIFETSSFSAADLERAEMYRVEGQREQLEGRYSTIDDYLQSLDMEITFERFDKFNLPRVVQLIQRSNQFNLTTRRYNQSDCEAFMTDHHGCLPFAVTLKDKFGSYGLISVVILKLGSDEIDIDEYLMSCRVLQRGVEAFTINSIFDIAKELGVKSVSGTYIRTKKNQMVEHFFHQFGFSQVDEDGPSGSRWSCSIDQYGKRPAFMRFTGSLNALRTFADEQS
jgi:FkbH-like protein